MKKSSSSSHTSQKSRETPTIKKDKKLVAFQYNQLNCFMSSSTQRTQRNIQVIKDKTVQKPKIYKEQVKQYEEDPKSNFSQIRIPRRNRGKITSNSKQAFNNSILLLEYENEEQRFDYQQKQRKQQVASNEEENQQVSNVVNSCVRVISEETEHTSNPISARYSSQTCTEAPPIYYGINHSYSANNIPLMVSSQQAYYYYIKGSPVRNKRSISYQQANAFIIDPNNIDMDGRTTVMVRNIPNKYTQEMLLKRFEQNHKKKFDFFYLPVDYTNNCNVGYAFINFIHAKFIREFYREFHQLKWEKFNSMKICHVCYARIQGTAQLQHHFENSNVIQQKQKKYRPLIGLKNVNGNINDLVDKQRGKQCDEVLQE